MDVDYNAWWMCLIPRSVAEDLGLPLPLFIKWDDAEYGLRARSRGYRTATVPGIAIWHMSFLEKDDTSDWQAYFHYRNRLWPPRCTARTTRRRCSPTSSSAPSGT